MKNMTTLRMVSLSVICISLLLVIVVSSRANHVRNNREKIANEEYNEKRWDLEWDTARENAEKREAYMVAKETANSQYDAKMTALISRKPKLSDSQLKYESVLLESERNNRIHLIEGIAQKRADENAEAKRKQQEQFWQDQEVEAKFESILQGMNQEHHDLKSKRESIEFDIAHATEDLNYARGIFNNTITNIVDGVQYVEEFINNPQIIKILTTYCPNTAFDFIAAFKHDSEIANNTARTQIANIETSVL